MKKIRVGIADDNREFCFILSEYFKGKENVEIVWTAHDGMETMRMFNSAEPDVLLIDLVLPNLDGFEVMERIRANSRNTNTKIIALPGENGFSTSPGRALLIICSRFPDMLVKTYP